MVSPQQGSSKDGVAIHATHSEIFERLHAIIMARKGADATQSYVAGLWAGGVDRIAKKFGEEAIETVIAAKNSDPQALISEMADVWFHAVVLLAAHDVAPDDVLAELERRFGQSGVAEKAARSTEGQRSDVSD
ncbi:MAG: phosphoribosyl-ATP diphosphatase [Thioalkalivibrionaceae bacterium]